MRYQVSDIMYQILSNSYQVSDINRYQVSDIKYQVSSIRLQVSRCKYQYARGIDSDN